MSAAAFPTDRRPLARALVTLRRLATRWQGHWGWLALPFLALPALAPMWQYGLLRGHDASNHILRLVNFHENLSAGLLYPRWVPNLALGYGYPLYNFYGPASYFLMEGLRVAGASFTSAFLLTLALLLVVAGWGMWLLAGDMLHDLGLGGSQWLPLVAAVAYMYSPYLLTNMYIRGAVAEVMAQALLPWVFWSFRRLLVAPSDRRFVVAAGLLLPLLMTAHTLSMLLAPPILAAYLVLAHGRGGLVWRAPAAAGLAALGVSAFFWLPVAAERGHVATGAQTFARTWMQDNFLEWHNLTDWSLIFQYRYDTPFGLGFTQVALAALGFALARSRRREWVVVALGGLALIVLMSRVAEPLWLAVPEVAAIQFPWRLMGLAALPLAALTAGLLAPLRQCALRGAAGVLLAGLIIIANQPRLGWVDTLPELTGGQTPPTIAQVERTVGDLGLSFNARLVNSDFIPRWVDLRQGLRGQPPATDQLPTQDLGLSLTAASASEWRLRVTSDRPATLRLTSFYFPGWRAWLDGGTEVPLYPTTVMGLLTVDVPAGDHDLRIAWAGTGLQWVGTTLSWLTLAALSIWAWRVVRPRALAGLPAVALAVGLLAGAFGRPALRPLIQPPETVKADGLELLGTRTVLGKASVDLHPYWFVRAAPGDLEVIWQLLDPNGQPVNEARTRPYYDTLPAYSWRTGTVVDDAYRLALPPGLAAGDYALRFCFVPAAERAGCAAWHSAGTLSLPAIRGEARLPAEAQPLALTFTGELELGGHSVRSDRGPLPTSANGLTIARAGQRLYYTLYWRGQGSENYHSYLHLVDSGGSKVAGLDHTPGPFYTPPRQWDRFYWQPDPYAFALPAALPSGVYQPLMGLYRFETLESLPVTNPAGEAVDNTVRLPPLKVLGAAPGPPQQPLRASFAGLGELLGYTLTAPAGGVRAGDRLTLTVHYRGLGGDPRDLREFVHLYDPALGLAAQHDAPPQQGANPTWAWLPGEVIASVIPLQLDPATPPGAYTLLLGFYDPAAANARVPALDAAGQRWMDEVVILTELVVAP